MYKEPRLHPNFNVRLPEINDKITWAGQVLLTVLKVESSDYHVRLTVDGLPDDNNSLFITKDYYKYFFIVEEQEEGTVVSFLVDRKCLGFSMSEPTHALNWSMEPLPVQLMDVEQDSLWYNPVTRDIYRYSVKFEVQHTLNVIGLVQRINRPISILTGIRGSTEIQICSNFNFVMLLPVSQEFLKDTPDFSFRLVGKKVLVKGFDLEESVFLEREFLMHGVPSVELMNEMKGVDDHVHEHSSRESRSARFGFERTDSIKRTDSKYRPTSD